MPPSSNILPVTAIRQRHFSISCLIPPIILSYAVFGLISEYTPSLYAKSSLAARFERSSSRITAPLISLTDDRSAGFSMVLKPRPALRLLCASILFRLSSSPAAMVAIYTRLAALSLDAISTASISAYSDLPLEAPPMTSPNLIPATLSPLYRICSATFQTQATGALPFSRKPGTVALSHLT
jgi:hypothetical protein